MPGACRWTQKIRGTIEKYVLREAARPVLTATVYARQKHPFMTPPGGAGADGRLYELIQDTLRGPTLAALPFFDPRRSWRCSTSSPPWTRGTGPRTTRR